MNAQASRLNYAQEQKRKELIKELSSAGYVGFSDGRTLDELTLRELQEMFRDGERE